MKAFRILFSMKLRKIKFNKRLIIILLIFVITFVLGLLYPALINKGDISPQVTTYIDGLHNNKYVLSLLIRNNLINNIFLCSCFYIFSIFIISFIIVIILYLIKIFSLGVSISSLIYIYKFKGIIYSLIIAFPNIIELILLTILFYYSLSYVIIILKYKNKISRKRLMKKYFIVFLIILILQVIISFVEGYIDFYFFKFI